MKRFGELTNKEAKQLPFFASPNKDDVTILKVVFEHYMPIDVRGDGNCGPYSFLLAGLNMAKSHSDLQKEFEPLRNDRRYKEIANTLRKDIRDCLSRMLTANISREFFAMQMGFVDEAVMIDELNSIYQEGVDYFPGETLESEYHCPPQLASLGLSIMHRCRVVCFEAKKRKDEYEFSTHIYDSRESKSDDTFYRGQIEYYDGIYKIPDDSFDPTDTIEYVYVNYTSCGHFIYLKRHKRMSADEVKRFEQMAPNILLPAEEPPPAATRNKRNDNRAVWEIIDEATTQARDQGKSQSETEAYVKEILGQTLAERPTKKAKKRGNVDDDEMNVPWPATLRYVPQGNYMMGVPATGGKQLRYEVETIEKLFGAHEVRRIKAHKTKSTRTCLGDSTVKYTSPPKELVTKVRTFYQQADRDYCLPYSFASGLRYCGFDDAATAIASYEDYFSHISSDWALNTLVTLMEAHCPLIGLPTKFNVKGKRKLTVEDLLENPTPYPTLVVPVGKNGFCGHCLCVVDDLIFDSITPFALRLKMDSLEWIFGVPVQHIYIAFRFQNKVSKKMKKIHGTYNRQVVYH